MNFNKGYVILGGLGLALLIAASEAMGRRGVKGGVNMDIFLDRFFIYGGLATGGLLVAYIVYSISRAWSSGGGSSEKPRRPTRSRDNELGSSNLAMKSQIKAWTKKTDDLDTVLITSDLVGGDGMLRGEQKIIFPREERNRHTLIIAKTGSGKTTKAILPILYSDCLSKTRSTIIIDSKPEMWDKLAGMTAKYNPEKEIILFNPLDTLRSLSWNIVSKVENDTDAKLIANTIIMATDQPTAKSDSPFFRNNALQLLNAMMVGLLNDPEEVLSIPRVHQLLHAGKEALCGWLEAHPHAIRNARTFVELARSGSQNADTVLSELGMRLSAWDLEAIRATTFAEEIDLETIVEKPSLFIVEFRESEIEMLRPMANTIVIEVLRFLTKRAESCPGQKLPRPVGLVIDEFASSLGRLPDIHVKLNTLRSRNVSIVAAIQSVAQIKANYEKDADSVLAGFSTKILMPSLDQQDAEWASKETGTMTVRYKLANKGTNRKIIENFATNNRGHNEQIQQRAVLTPDEIGRPIDNVATFFLPNTAAFQGHLIPFYKIPYMVKAIGDTSVEVNLREEPIEYQEILPEPIFHQAEGGDEAEGNGQAIGAIQPATKVVHTGSGASTEEELRAELERMKTRLGWEETDGVAKEWWETFEKENADKVPVLIALCQEIEKRDATLYEFFVAYVYSDSDNIEENLEFLERMKEEQEKIRAEQAQVEQAEITPEPVVQESV